MAYLSGQNGKVTLGSVTIAEVTHWTFTDRTKLSEWSSTDTPGYLKRVGSVADAGGSFDFRLDLASPQWDSAGGIVSSGMEYTGYFYVDATHYITVPLFIQEVTYDVDIDNGPAITGKATWASTGAWAYPTTAAWGGM